MIEAPVPAQQRDCAGKNLAPRLSFAMRPLFPILLVLLVSACSSNFNSQNWPVELPAISEFERAWQDDAVNARLQSKQEYLAWIVSFYEGSLVYSSGWLQLEAQVIALDAAQNQQRPAGRHAQLQELGGRIAEEWAKHNDVRKIDSRMLSIWGSVIQLSPDAPTRDEAIAMIAEDVAALREGKLAAAEVGDDRYAQALNLQLFEDF